MTLCVCMCACTQDFLDEKMLSSERLWSRRRVNVGCDALLTLQRFQQSTKGLWLPVVAAAAAAANISLTSFYLLNWDVVERKETLNVKTVSQLSDSKQLHCCLIHSQGIFSFPDYSISPWLQVVTLGIQIRTQSTAKSHKKGMSATNPSTVRI